jgi:hypothetical protein
MAGGHEPVRPAVVSAQGDPLEARHALKCAPSSSAPTPSTSSPDSARSPRSPRTELTHRIEERHAAEERAHHEATQLAERAALPQIAQAKNAKVEEDHTRSAGHSFLI